MNEVPEHLQRNPTRNGRIALASRLGLTINPFSQDWEWEIAQPERFAEWLEVYKCEPMADDERFSLMEMLIQCVDDIVISYGTTEQINALPQWQAVQTLLLANPQLHASSIVYWSVFDCDDTEAFFQVSLEMRKVWDAVRPALI